MARRNFYKIIKNIRTNITKEYSRINELFESTDSGQSVRDMIEDAFFMFPKSFRGRTISLDDLDETYGFSKRMFIAYHLFQHGEIRNESKTLQKIIGHSDLE